MPTLPTSHVPMDVFELGQVTEATSHVQGHGGQSAIRNLIELLSITFVDQMTPLKKT
jgi:hypothetical protein